MTSTQSYNVTHVYVTHVYRNLPYQCTNPSCQRSRSADGRGHHSEIDQSISSSHANASQHGPQEVLGRAGGLRGIVLFRRQPATRQSHGL